jgi:heptose I phosphotransferase
VNLILDVDIQKQLKPDTDLFDQMMAMRGEVFRNKEGRRTQRVLIGNEYYFLKQHTGIGWKEIFKNLVQGRLPVLGAYNEYAAIQQLTQLAIPTMRIRGYGSRGLNPACQHSFILTDELSHTVSLEDYSKEWKTKPPELAIKRALISKVAQMARTMHQNGMNHRDFYICHFLLCLQSLPNLKLYLIDLHRAQLRKKVPKRWLIKDLAGLYFSSKAIGLTQTDLLRFLKHYTQQSLRAILTTEKNFWEQVIQRGDQLYQAHY